MQQPDFNPLNPNHSAPVGRLRLEIVDLKNPGLDASAHGTIGTGTASATITFGTVGSFSDED